MRQLLNAWRWLGWVGRRDNLDRGLDDEIRFHVDRQTEKLIAAGLDPDEARRQALIRFGGVQATKERTRDELRPARLERVVREFRYAGRSLLRTPAFTCVAVLTLALGIGATTAMFSVVNAVLLRPLPYAAQDRLVELVHTSSTVKELFASPAIYFGYRDHGRAFDAVGLWNWDGSPVTVIGGGEPESVPSVQVTHEVLAILGATPAVGRLFTAADDTPGAAPAVVISYGYWRRHFGDSDPVGRTLNVVGVPRQIIGV